MEGHSDPAAGGSDPQGRRKHRFSLGLGAVALALAIGAGGYALGTGSGPDLEHARAKGAEEGERRGLAAGSREGYRPGLRAGRRAAYLTSYRKAYASAYRRGYEEVAGQGPTPEEGQPSSCPTGTVSATNGCVPEQQAVCAAYQDFVPGTGCVPPLEPGQREATPQCPPGQVPVGVTGACAKP